MNKLRGGPGPPPQDIYEFSLDEDDAKVLLRGKAMGMVSPLAEYIQSEHHNGGFFPVVPPEAQDTSGAVSQQKKKRRRCGVCGPCLRKENCGTCTNCLNRKTGHQICKLRKCDQLKKKASSWEVGYFEEDIKDQPLIQNLAAETVSRVALVHGPSGRGQMEIGSHDHLVDGVLSQEPANGVSRHLTCEEGDVSGGEGAGRGGRPQVWGAGTGSHDKASYPQGQAPPQSQQLQQDCWSGGTLNAVDMEDARNLVAFSASAGSLLPSTGPESQPCTAQLYEKFNQEMAAGRADKGERCPPEDINTLQTALSQARHGHKPPNCDCDGPDCPDYLEWLEKKIKLAADSQQGKTHCKMSEALQSHPQPHQASQHPPPQPNGASSICGQGAPAQALGEKPPALIRCSPAPIPCSPSVLSIAKEKNISLETAIALEALTQLSDTIPQTVDPPAEASINHPQQYAAHHQSMHPQHGTRLMPSSPAPLSSSSQMPQQQQQQQTVRPVVDPQQDSRSWEQHRPQSQGEAPRTMMPHHPSQYSPSVSPFLGPPHPRDDTRSPLPQQWQQGPRGSSPRPTWMGVMNPESQPQFAPPPQGSNDPMSELKQLLGDASGKYVNAGFRFPAPQPLPNDMAGPHPRTPNIKQEVDGGEYLNSAMARYVMMNGQQLQQQYPGSPLSPATLSIRHSTQAALQQHLHHKRNLFSNSLSPGQRAPMACQNLRKWWPQMPADMPMMPIKQEPKEPKKKTPQSSPLTKLGPPLPKPKQIVIKKVKQKASQPTFLPHNQIVVQKATAKAQSLAAQFLPGMGAGSVPAFPFPNSSQAVAAPVPPAQSQESILNGCSVAPSLASSVAGIAPPASVPLPVALAAPRDDSATSDSHGGPAASAALAPTTSTPQTSAAAAQPAPLLTGLSSLDPKFEDLIRQFEEEFGETPASSTAPASEASTLTTGPNPPQPEATEPQQDANSGQAKPTSPPAEQPNAPSDGQRAMEVGGKQTEAGVASEGAHPVSTQSLAVSQTGQQGELPSSTAGPLSLDALLGPAQQQCQMLQDTFATPASKRMKIESSGGVTVISTTSCLTPGTEDDTPTKDGLPMTPSLKGFLESPLRYLDTPTKNLLDTPAKDNQAEFPLCDCVEHILEKDEGPYYNHLGAGPTVASIRDLMEARYGEKGEAVRIEKVVYTGREGKSSQGCPIAKWVIRRSGEKEKLLCLVRHRAGHHCANAVIIILIMAWEGVPRFFADKLYQEITQTLTKYGNPTSRRCGLNDDRTCACQGKDSETCGASFSFGCSWSMYFNGCKYARSKLPRKFRLQGDRPEDEGVLRDNFQSLATHVAPLYKQLAPQAYSNQCQHENEAIDCRLGLKEGRPFSGVTACMDFCAHAHKDQHNLHNGCTVVCTLTKEDNRTVGVLPEDEQLHVLPLYKVSNTDEFGSAENQRLKMQTGAIHVLSNFRREVRKLPEPAKSCRQRRLEAKKAAMEKKKGPKTPAETPEKTIKTETIHRGSPHPQQGNKAIPKQEMKPNIKKEPVDRYHSFNGALPPGYPAPGNGQAAEPYGGINNAYSYPGYYARGGLPSNSQTPAAAPVNGFHPNLPALPYGYCNYPPKALFPPELMGYEGRSGSWPKGAAVAAGATSFDQKPDVQSLQARLGHAFPDQPERHAEDPAVRGYVTPSNAPQPHGRPSHTPTPPPEPRRATPVIKQEPMDVPVYGNCRPDAGSQSCPGTPSTTPQPPESWPGHRPNGLMSKGWEGPHRPGAADSPFPPDKQMLHQNPTHHPQHAYSQQQQQQQWNHFHGHNTPMASPAPSPSPSLKQGFSPAPSPHPTTPRHWESPSPSGQPKVWPAGFSPAVKLENPAGGFPDKMLSRAGESRGSTPLGLQEKAWRSGGGSAAGSTPSPAPEGRLFPDALQRPDAQGCWTPCKSESEAESQGERELDDDEVWSDSEHNFLDPNIGGVAVAPAHGSVLIECARRELHATTPLKRPDRSHPSRISLVFYQHKNLNQPCHGLALWEAKMKLLAERARQRQEEAILLGLPPEDIKVFGKKRKWASGAASPSPGPAKDKREGVATRLAPTLNTSSLITVSSYAYTQLTGPYSRLV
ncbi:methylcytosine dioxygenase TET3 isoform X1 [Alosa pseudoharengus]|uniref:methylcytosine dioxygenase TET3 isoform X1 n=2 Tax=Alosa pseudoharengus TaxID=34774 RepID=UPI003F8C03CB